MNISYHLAEKIVIAEFALIGIIVVWTLILKATTFIGDRYKKRIKQEIIQYLNSLIHHKIAFQARNFHYRWKNLALLTQVVDEFDANNQTNYWHEIRATFITSIMTPLARKATFSRDWRNRFYAIKAFGLNRDKSNNHYIETLLEDKIPLITIYAGKAALINHTEAAIDALIKRMGTENWGTQLLDLHSFDCYPPESRAYFVRKLEVAEDANVRTACYKVLLRYRPEKCTWNIEKDIQSPNVELKIAAIKFIAHADRTTAIPMLTDILAKAPSLEVKLVVINRLNWLKATEAIKAIVHCLSDSDWQVKMSAAEALKNMGEEGKSALKANHISLDHLSFNPNQP